MKVQIVNPLPMQWEASYLKLFEGDRVRLLRDIRKEALFPSDLTIFMWADRATAAALHHLGNKLGKIIVFMRRYEYYAFPIEDYKWQFVSAVICVNDFLARGFRERTGIMPYVIYNAVDPEAWTYRNRTQGNKVAVVGYVEPRKNLPMALQIMAMLPTNYELHVAGEIRCAETADYLVNLADSMNVNAFLHGPVTGINAWLEDKDYLLCTSISEGCPNNVVEAMAKGIKPVVNTWPGAVEQFGEWTECRVDNMADAILRGPYESSRYREIVLDRFGPGNYREFRRLVDGVMNG